MRLPSVTVVLTLALLLLSLLGYMIARKVTIFTARPLELHAFALTLFRCVAALPFTAIRYGDIPRLLRTIIRGIGIVVLVQVPFDVLGPPLLSP